VCAEPRERGYLEKGDGRRTHKRERKKAHVGRGVPQQQVATTWRGWCRPPSGPSRCSPCETPCFALRMPADWRRRRRNVKRGRSSTKTACTRSRRASQRAKRAILRLFGDTRESTMYWNRYAHLSQTKSLLTPIEGTGIPCEFWTPEISQEMHSMPLRSLKINRIGVLYFFMFSFQLYNVSMILKFFIN